MIYIYIDLYNGYIPQLSQLYIFLFIPHKGVFNWGNPAPLPFIDPFIDQLEVIKDRSPHGEVWKITR